MYMTILLHLRLYRSETSEERFSNNRTSAEKYSKQSKSIACNGLIQESASPLASTEVQALSCNKKPRRFTAGAEESDLLVRVCSGTG